jgi:biotin transporter BioY
MSYPFAAFIAGWLSERGFDRHYFSSVIAMATGLVLIFVCGVVWLAWFARPTAAGLDAALHSGLYPFLPADIFKILVAAAIMPGLWRLTGRIAD